MMTTSPHATPGPTNSPSCMNDPNPLYTIIGSAVGGTLILSIVLLLLIICYLAIRLKKTERKLKRERAHTRKNIPLGNGDGGGVTHQQSSSPLDLTETTTGIYTTIDDEEIKRMKTVTKYADPPASQEVDASYASVSHDVCRKTAARDSCGDPRGNREQPKHDAVASAQTSSITEPHKHSEPIKRAAVTEESEYSQLQHHTNVASSSNRHSAPLLSSMYDQLAFTNGGSKESSFQPQYSKVVPKSKRKPRDPQPASQSPSNPPTSHIPASNAFEHMYHVLENTQQAGTAMAFNDSHLIPPHAGNLGSESVNGASSGNHPKEVLDLYDSIKEATAPQAIYDAAENFSQGIYDDIK